MIVFKTQDAHVVWGQLNVEKPRHLLEVPRILRGRGGTLRISFGRRDHGRENQGGCLGLQRLPSPGSSGKEQTAAGVLWWGCLEMG